MDEYLSPSQMLPAAVSLEQKLNWTKVQLSMLIIPGELEILAHLNICIGRVSLTISDVVSSQLGTKTKLD